jgi:hypothetical protein
MMRYTSKHPHPGVVRHDECGTNCSRTLFHTVLFDLENTVCDAEFTDQSTVSEVVVPNA